MTVNEVRAHFEKHGASICAHIREGRYIPAAVKRVDIPKPSGGTRMLGIPTVQDRVIQQAIAQVLSKHFDPLWNWDVGAEFRISIKKPGLQGLRP